MEPLAAGSAAPGRHRTGFYASYAVLPLTRMTVG